MAETGTIRIEELLRHQAWLRRIAGGLVKGDADADDLVQETWLAAIRRPPRHDRSTKGWLATVTRNAANQLRRGERSRRRRETANAIADVQADTSRMVERVELQRLVAREVLALGEPWRQVVLLRYFDELSSAEIARRLGIPASTVRNRLKRGLELLRERLDAGSGGDRRLWVMGLAPLLFLPRRAAAAPALPVAALTFALIAVIAAVGTIVFATEPQAPPDSPPETTVARAVLDGKVPAAASVTPAAGGMGGIAAAQGAGPTPSLSGRVTFARGGAPCAGAEVVAEPEGADRYGRGETQSTVTNADGRYELFDLPRGFCAVRVHPEDAPTAVRRVVRVASGGAVCDLRILPGVRVFGRVLADDTGAPVPGARVSVPGSPRLSSVTDRLGRYEIRGFPRGTSFPAVGLHRGGVIAVAPPVNSNLVRAGGRTEMGVAVQNDPLGGDVEFDIRLERGGALAGRVVGPDGEGVAGVRVSRDLLVEGGHYPGPDTMTGSDGSFLLTNLQAGVHKLCAHKSGYPVKESASPPVEIGKVTAGALIRFSRGGKVSGSLVGEDGLPAVGVLIYYRQRAPREHQIHGLNPGAQVTDAQGSFCFTDVPGGAAWLEICAGEYLAATFGGIDLGEGKTLEGLSIRLRRGAAVAGRVLREDGTPLVAARVRIDPMFDTRTLGLENRSVVPRPRLTDGEGRFRFTGLPAGSYRISTDRGGRVEWTPGDPAPIIRLENVGTLRGRVALEGGRPPGYFEVLCHPVGRPGHIVGPVAGSEDGSFALEGVLRGPCRIVASDGLGRTAEGEGLVGENIHLTLAPGGIVRGTLRDLSGRLAQCGRVTVRPVGDTGGRPMRGEVSRSGDWVAGPLVAGTWEIRARYGKGQCRTEVEVAAGATVTCILQLDCSRAVSVVVVDRQGKPVPAAVVDIQTASGETVEVGNPKYRKSIERNSRGDPKEAWEKFQRTLRTTAWDGQVVIHDLKPGEYVVSVGDVSADFTVSETHCARARLTLK